MKNSIKKTVSSFLAIFMIFGLFVITDDPTYLAAETALQNTSYMSSETFTKDDTISITCRASGSTGFYQYAVYYKKTTDEKWTTLQSYCANVNLTFKPKEMVDYDICIKVKDNKGTESKKYFVLKANNELVNNSVLNKTSIKLGESITATGVATGGTGNYQYQVLYKRTSQTKWTVAQSYKANASVSFKPAAAVTYDVCVKVKDSSGAEVKKFFTVQVTNALQNTSKISAQSIKLGETVTVTASATGGTGKYTYAVYYKKDYDQKWTTKQDYKANSTISVKPAKQALYNICVKVKDSDGTIVKKYFDVTVSDVLQNTSTISSDTIKLGETIKVSCSAKGGSGFYQYAVYYKKQAESKWTTKQNYSSNISVSIKPANATKYDICVKVKDDKETIDKKYFVVSVVANIISHTMQHTAYKSATCTSNGNIEYWYCSDCEKYFKDEKGTNEILASDTIIKSKGHTEVIDPAVTPTYTSTGLTEGSHCSVCGTIIKRQEILPTLKKTEYVIEYDINNDYLREKNVQNPNPSIYAKEEGLTLKNLKAVGFRFLGWYTAAEGGTLVTEIPVNSTGDKELYAQWKEIEYTITFDSPDVPVSSKKYTVSTGATLSKPSLRGYTFVGWSKDGKIVTTIPKGTIGNLTLHANWTSDRNQAEAIERLEAPEIIEDYENGTILFIYEIGTIHNIPLSRIDVGENAIIGPSDGLNLSKTYRYTTTVDESYAKTVANTISNATTKSSEWTLSEDWNKTTQATDERMEICSKTQEIIDEYGNVIGSRYYIGNSAGGSTSSTVSAGGSTALAAKVTMGDSVGISGSYTHETEKGLSAGLTVGGKYDYDFQFIPEIGIGYDGLEASTGGVGANHGLEISGSGEIEAYQKDKKSATLAASRNISIGKEIDKNSENHWDANNSVTSNWNTESGYEKSQTVSQSQSVSKAISDTINNRWEYSSMDSRGGSNSKTQSTGESQELRDEYSSTVEYSVEKKEELETTQNTSRSEYGYYRLVNAGTAHVFAVVGYDIATNSYFTYTYNVLDKERHIFLDFSMKNASFNDCENAIIPFEIPIFVNNYVNSIMNGSDGLSVDENGYISGKYEGNAEYVVIPEYVSIKNSNKTYSAVRVHGFTSEVFKNNNTIKGIYLPKYITEIPNNAFENCTSLNTVEGYGITSIGSNAFKGCTALSSFVIDEYITFLGNNAFEGVGSIDVTAANTNVVDAAIASGAKRISLDLSNMANSDNNQFRNKVLTISNTTEFFHIMSNNATYTNISIKSDAADTRISNIIFKNNSKTPMDISSPKILLGQVKVESCDGLALVLRADNTDLELFGNIEINSSAQYTSISKNVTLIKNDPKMTSLLKVNGIHCICGDMQNQDIFSGTIKKIQEDEFNALLTSSKVTFDPNGGTISVTSQRVYFGQTYGSLPTPTRDYCKFEGWYTSDGTRIYDNTVFTGSSDITLYAHWSSHVPSGWTLASNVPSGAKIEERKWTYTQREYTESGSYSLDGWIKYETRRTGWGPVQGPVDYDPSNGERNVWSESYVTSSNYKTVYHYYRYANSYTGGKGSYTNYYSNYYQYDFDWELEETSSIDGHRRFMYWYCDTNWTGVYMCDPFTTQEWVSDNYGTRWYFQDPIYTYYYYRDVNKESGSNPSGSNISNVQEWVRYIPK